MLSDLNLKFYQIDEKINELDILVEGFLYIEPRHADIIRKNGGKIVCYKMGNDVIYDVEAFLHNKPSSSSFNGTLFDSHWFIPQMWNTNSSYFAIMQRSEPRLIPFIWSPLFLDKAIKDLSQPFDYLNNKDNSKETRRISSFEPNISIFKNCFIDILIAEQAFRERPELIEHVFICNTYDKREIPAFRNFIGRTDLLKNGKISV